MFRIFMVAAIAAFVCATPAIGQPSSDPDPARPATKPADAPNTISVEPLAVPKWMGQAVDHILTGDDSMGR